MRIDLHASQVREEIALVMPHLLRPPKTPPRPAVNNGADNAAPKKMPVIAEQRPKRRGD